MPKRRWFVAAAGLAAGAALVGLTRYAPSEQNARAVWSELSVPGDGEPFRPEMVDALPPPARRYLLRAISPGTPLTRTVEVSMRGEILLDPDRAPMAMRAEQIFAPPDGFVWRARAGTGAMRINGFDLYGRGHGEMRWMLWDLIPVMRATSPDITCSAAGRLAMESVMMPASLVPGRGAEWEPLDEGRTRFRMTVGAETVVTTVEVDEEGRPLRASAWRWTGDASGGGPGYELFVVELTGDLSAGGYTIPRRVVAGWRLGQPDEFRFFDATLERATFR
jgi:hypothetical protein